jgi:hypothetical protein
MPRTLPGGIIMCGKQGGKGPTEADLAAVRAFADRLAEPKPPGCDCNPREATIDEDMNIVCAECGALLERA